MIDCEWMTDAACAKYSDKRPWDIDYPEHWPSGRVICVTDCPVRMQCREHAMAIGTHASGMYGGLIYDAGIRRP